MTMPAPDSYQKEQVAAAALDRTLLLRLFRYVKPYRLLIGFSITILLIARSIEAAVPIFIGKIVQQVFDNHLPQADADKIALFHTLAWQAGIVMALLCVVYLIDGINLFLRNWVGQRVILSMRQQVFNHIQHLPAGTFDNTPVGKLMTRTIHDVDQIDQMFSESIVPFIGNLLLFAGVLIGIFIVNWHIAAILLLLIPILWLLTSSFRTRQQQCYEMVRRIVSAMNGFLQEFIGGASVIQHLSLQHYEESRFKKINQDYRHAQVQALNNFSFFFASIDFLQSLLLITVFTSLVLLGTDQQPFQAGAYFTFSLYALMIFRPIADLAERYNVLQSAIAAARRVFDVLDQRVESHHGN